MRPEHHFSTDQAPAAIQMIPTARHDHDAELWGYSGNPQISNSDEGDSHSSVLDSF